MPSVSASPAQADALAHVLHALPQVWRASTLAGRDEGARPSGHAALDAELPGGGWPAAGLVELLQDRAARHDWALLLPTLAALLKPAAAPGTSHDGFLLAGPLVLVGAPQAPAGVQPFAPALAAGGVPPERLLWVQPSTDALRVWACEQALRCADVVAVLAWLPVVRADVLRRLHLQAVSHHKPLFVFRSMQARQASSPAPLRLLLAGEHTLQVHVLKRRGPPLEQSVVLPAYAPALAALLGARRQAGVPAQTEERHALARAAAAA